MTGYTLALATVIPLTGWAADRFGTKRLYMISIALFVLGSMLSGLAWSAESLIFFRVLQGFGGGMIMPAGMTILTRAAGPQRVGRVMAIIGVPMLLGPIFGPILGGWLVDDFSWRWIFFINLPIGDRRADRVAGASSPRDVPKPDERLDWLGFALLSPGLALIIYGLAESGSAGGFGARKVIGPGLVGARLLAGFVLPRAAHAERADRPAAVQEPHLHGRLGHARSLVIIASSAACCCCRSTCRSCAASRAMDTGLLLAPQGFGAMVAMPIAGRLTDRTGVGRIVPVGLVIVAPLVPRADPARGRHVLLGASAPCCS